MGQPVVEDIEHACAMAAEMGRRDLVYRFRAADAAYWASLCVRDELVAESGQMVSARYLRERDRTDAVRALVDVLELDGVVDVDHPMWDSDDTTTQRPTHDFRAGDIVDWAGAPERRVYVSQLHPDGTLDLQVDGAIVAEHLGPGELGLVERYHLVTLDAVLHAREMHDELRVFAREYERFPPHQVRELLRTLQWLAERLEAEVSGTEPTHLAVARLRPASQPSTRGPSLESQTDGRTTNRDLVVPGAVVLLAENEPNAHYDGAVRWVVSSVDGRRVTLGREHSLGARYVPDGTRREIDIDEITGVQRSSRPAHRPRRGPGH